MSVFNFFEVDKYETGVEQWHRSGGGTMDITAMNSNISQVLFSGEIAFQFSNCFLSLVYREAL